MSTAVQCSFNFIQLPFGFCQPKIKTLSQFTSTLHAPFSNSTPSSGSSNLKLSAKRNSSRVCVVVSEENPVGFWIPWLYDAAKRFLKNFSLSDLPDQIDCLLITQSLDDHCHLKTLRPLSKKYPDLRVIATPNAKALLDPLFSNVIYLEPGQSYDISVGDNSNVKVQATAGPVLGPPWQRPENGYIVTSPRDQLSLYYEPHCVYDKTSIDKEQADIVITPVIKQLLPGLTLVSGQEDAVKLAKLLNAKFIVPMKNGDLDSKGLLSKLIRSEGTIESFKAWFLVLSD
ncbi:unnamed protein product [Rhodiola kirilowii]